MSQFLSDAECARRWREMQRFVRDADQPTHDPNRALGGPGATSWRRNALPVGWSTSKPVRAGVGKAGPTPGTVIASVQDVLSVQGAGGAAQVWSVLASGRVSANNPGAVLANQFLRLTWTAGGVTRVAEMDLPAQSTCFPVTADSMRLQAVNQTLFDFEVDAFVAPCVENSDWRAPRRTVHTQWDIATAQVLRIPAFAQQVCYICSNPSVAAVGTAIAFRDSAGFVYGETLIQPFAPPVSFDLPGNATEIALPAVPGLVGIPDISFIFRLGF